MDNADGQVEVENSLLRKNFFLRRGYLIDPSVDSLIDLSNGGGLLSQEAINEVTYIYGPRGDGIHLNGDSDFMDHNPPAPYDVGIDRNDKYQNLFLAYFHCKLDRGRYEFGVEWPDDRASVWLDLDQDGVFELEGDRGTELMNGPTYQRGFMEVSLDKGFYKYAVAHREGGGGSRVDARFRAIVGPGPTTLVRPNPGDAKQDGLWVQYQPIDVFTEGEYEITYSAKDSAGNTSEIKRKVIVKTNPDAPIIYLKGEESITLNYGDAFEDPGSFVEDLDGNTVEGDLRFQAMSILSGWASTAFVTTLLQLRDWPPVLWFVKLPWWMPRPQSLPWSEKQMQQSFKVMSILIQVRVLLIITMVNCQ